MISIYFSLSHDLSLALSPTASSSSSPYACLRVSRRASSMHACVKGRRKASSSFFSSLLLIPFPASFSSLLLLSLSHAMGIFHHV